MSVKTYSYKKHKDLKLGTHFTAGEFACFNSNGALQSDKFLHNTALVPLLEKLFTKLNCKSILVTSGYRTPDFSVSIGGFKNDQHTKGNAADIVCYDQKGKEIDAKKVCCALEDLGHKGGVGYICSTATHVDVRGTKAYFDEIMDGGATAFPSFYSHWGIKKPVSLSALKSAVQKRFGFSDSTMKYLSKHPNPKALFTKLLKK